MSYLTMKDNLKKYQPEFLTGIGLISTMATAKFAMQKGISKAKWYKIMWEQTGNKFYEIRYMQLTHSNNWLKMHGYPMRKRVV